MLVPPSPTPPPQSVRRGRLMVVYWVVVAAVYAVLGILSPPAFLLGFWESWPLVFLATFLAPKVLGRRDRG